MKTITHITGGSVSLGEREPLVLFAGPCVIEGRDSLLRIAEALVGIAGRVGMPLVFKASFDKANRSSAGAFRGPGQEEGLRDLAAVADTFGLPVLTDIHHPDQAAAAAEVASFLQIPAFLCRQTDLIVAAARTGAAVNIKKGQFMAPEDMRQAVEKALCAGNGNVMLTERGTSHGYHDLVVDYRSLAVMRGFCPVVFDATHSVQQPGTGAGTTGGCPAFIPLLARAAAAAGIDGLFLEVHPEPSASRSDAASIFPLQQLESLLREVLAVWNAVSECAALPSGGYA